MTSNIRNEDYYLSGFWEWAPYNECFLSVDGKPTGIRISDIDGHVERNGHFLWIEASQNDSLSIGQQRSINRRVARGDTVVVLHGEPNEPALMTVYRPFARGNKSFCDQQRLRRFFRGWMLWAEANGWVDHA